jgi:hypothetical protein
MAISALMNLTLAATRIGDAACGDSAAGADLARSARRFTCITTLRLILFDDSFFLRCAAVNLEWQTWFNEQLSSRTAHHFTSLIRRPKR